MIRRNLFVLINRLLLVILYCLPCLIALSIAAYANYSRVTEVAKKYAETICKEQKGQKSPDNPENKTSDQFQRFVIATKECCKCEQEVTQDNTKALFDNIWPRFYQYWRGNLLFISVLTLLPFLILGGGLAFRLNITNKNACEHVVKGDFQENTIMLFIKDWPLKLLVGLAIALGWLYVFNPFGWGGSAVNSWLKYYETISVDTSPIIFDLTQSRLKHFIAGFIGWYLYLLGYFLYRFYKSDVTSTRIYGILLRRFLFVIGIAIVISSVSGNETLMFVFLVGTFPLSIVSLLSEYGYKSLDIGNEQTTLFILPGISTWQILRLEEEGIDSVAALASANLQNLKLLISSEIINPYLLDNWIDVAQLITILGAKKWKEIKGICLTATTFIEKEESKDSEFRSKLVEHQIFNSGEIAKLLKVSFPDARRNISS